MPPDPLIRRLQIGAALWCGAATALAVAIRPDAPRIAGGVLGGGLLSAVSLLAIRSSVDALIGLFPGTGLDSGPAGTARRTGGVALVKLAGRYALLGLLAYVMIARLRLHPIGVIVGASSLVAAATFEAVRVLTRTRR
ncbi:MAG TPA: hypothetical protein VIL35_15695 [Vicinamibacterales bacterium]